MRFPHPGRLSKAPYHLAAGLTFGLLALAAPMAAQMFPQPKVIPAQSWPSNVLAGDFDGDGNQDLLYLQFVPNTPAGQPDTLVEIVYGDGTGGFTTPVLQGSIYSVGGIATTVADMNSDGISDFVLVQGPVPPSREDTYTVWFGSMQRKLQPASPASMWSSYGSGVSHIMALNVSDYQYPELVVLDNVNNCEIFSSDGSGHFNPIFEFTMPGGTGPIFSYDLNGDGRPDLVVLSQSGHAVDVYLATGYAPPYVPATRYTGVSGAYSMLLADVDQDSHPDLVIEGANGRFDIFHGNADGTFATTSEGGSGSLDGTTGNGGHLVGITTVDKGTRHNFYTATPAGVSALIGQGNLTYVLKGIYNAGPGRTSYAVADFNGDGNLDLAVDSPEGIAMLFGNSDGSLQSSQAFAAGLPAMSGALGAFTSSGNLDAVVSTAAAQAQFLKGNGDGTFTYGGSPGAPVPTSSGAQTGIPNVISTVQVGDFNADGNLDIALTQDGAIANLPTGGDGLYLNFGKGNGTFAGPSVVTTPAAYIFPGSTTCSPSFPHYPGTFFGTSVIGDFNGDGITEIATLDPSATRVMLGVNGASPTVGFQAVNGTPPNFVQCSLDAHDLIVKGDLNNDGYLDLLVQRNGSLVEYLNDGKGNFTAAGDLRASGSPLISSGSLLAPDINPVFGGRSAALGFNAFPGSAVVADLDRDGNNDLIVSYANLSANRAAPTSAAPNYLYIWFGSGGGKFLTSASHPVNPVVLTPSRNYYQVAIADLNGDGIPDLILSDGYILSVQLGNGDGTFGVETHYLAGQGLNTISVADLDHNGTLDLVVANGGTVWGNPVANLDQPPATQDVNTGGITVLLNKPLINLPLITATVTATPEPSTYGNPFSLTATIMPSVIANNISATGSFSFTVNGISVGSATISGSTATLQVPASTYATLAPGVYTLTAAYSGDTNWAPSTVTGTHTVSLLPTTTSLLLCVDPPGSNFPCSNPIANTPLISPITMYYGQSVDGVAIESALNLTGTITFLSNTSVFCTLNANLQQGSQTCPPTSGFFPAGTTTVTAVYSGDSEHEASTSNPIVVTVYPDTTTATVTSSLNPAIVGQSVTFAADVQGNFAVGAGQVIFLDGTTTLGTATLDPTGHATLTISTLAIGTHPIRVAFPGSQNFNSTTSVTLNQVILASATPLPSTVTLASSINPSTLGQSVTFTATVTALGAFPGVPTGTVTFFDGAINLGNTVLNPATGVATLPVSTLAIGSHAITAMYSGATGNGATTPTILASTSAVLTQVVVSPIPPSFTLSVTPSPVTIGAGDTGILLVNVQALGGFSQPVALTCSGLPRESTCTFVQQTIPGGGGSTTLQLAVSAPHNCDSTTPYFVSGTAFGTPAKIALSSLFGGGILFAGFRRRRKLLIGTIFALLFSLCGLSLLSGCGACTDLGTKPGVYSFTVVGTASGEVQTQKIPLTVTIP